MGPGAATDVEIAFVTHGVGRTALAYEPCNELKKQDLDDGIIDEIARRCSSAINDSTSLEARTGILATTIARELELGNTYPDITRDRSVPENYVYLKG